MKRKRKLFTGVVPIGGPSVKSRRLARKITSKFHELNNKLGDSTQTDDIVAIEKEIEALGGRNRYQEASVVTTSHHKTSKWVVSTLQKLGVYPKGNQPKLNVLEVGAINIQLHQYPGLQVRSIDINSQHALIEEVDFFAVQPRAEYDVVVCSMVVNCVSTPLARGDMIARLSAHLKPATGLLFLVLPNRCVDNPMMSSRKFWSFLTAMNLHTPPLTIFFGGTQSATEACNTGGGVGIEGAEEGGSAMDELLFRKSPKLTFYVLNHKRSDHPSNMTKDVCWVPESWTGTEERCDVEEDEEINDVIEAEVHSDRRISLQPSDTAASIVSDAVLTNVYNIIQCMQHDISKTELRKFTDSGNSGGRTDMFELKIPHEILCRLRKP